MDNNYIQLGYEIEQLKAQISYLNTRHTCHLRKLKRVPDCAETKASHKATDTELTRLRALMVAMKRHHRWLKKQTEPKVELFYLYQENGHASCYGPYNNIPNPRSRTPHHTTKKVYCVPLDTIDTNEYDWNTHTKKR